MARRRNKNRRPGTQTNNGWGPKAVSFDDDLPMHGTDASPGRGRHLPNRRGGRNSSNRGRNAPPFGGPRNQHPQHQHGHNPFGSPHTSIINKTPINKRNNHNNRRGRRGGRGRYNNNDRSAFNDEYDVDDPFQSLADDLNININDNNDKPSPTPFSSSNSSNSIHRFCTECSSVRRANLRFRNWALHALQRGGEHFGAWAEDAGVGLATGDEMDWQPEPVVRVLLLAAPPIMPPPYPSCQQHDRDQDHIAHLDAMLNQCMPPQQPPPYVEKQQQGLGQNVAQDIGPLPVPGPWAWPAWSAAAAANAAANTNAANTNANINAAYRNVPPLYGQRPIPPTTASIPAVAPVPGLAPSSHNNSNGDVEAGVNVSVNEGGPMPVSGFGLLGASTRSIHSQYRPQTPFPISSSCLRPQPQPQPQPQQHQHQHQQPAAHEGSGAGEGLRIILEDPSSPTDM
ncbi:hypothetical protein F4819DRAFT_374719 [Hypoxylon fuscum]|nr:hypothetical protein F4819DRAFT_374719 [Hypoxylon fuscum]